MLRQVLLWVLIVLCAPPLVQAQRPGRSRPREERSFGAEGRMKYPVPLPREVLGIISSDEDVRNWCLRELGLHRMEASFFQASRVSLNNKGLLGLVVTSGDCYVGGTNNNRFWIFYRTPQGYRAVFDEMAFGVTILRTKTGGFYDIKVGTLLGPQLWWDLYKFDGSKYKVARSWKETYQKGE